MIFQQIHSLRASGVRLSQAVNAAGTEIRAIFKSAGILCATPPAMTDLLMNDLRLLLPTTGRLPTFGLVSLVVGLDIVIHS